MRAKPGTGGRGKYYRIVVRPKSSFKSFMVQNLGGRDGVERLAGKRRNGTWDTQAWLIPKSKAHVSGTSLAGKTPGIRSIISKLGSKPRKVGGDVFRAKPRKNVPENKKPTPAMKRAQNKNIKKAQRARRK